MCRVIFLILKIVLIGFLSFSLSGTLFFSYAGDSSLENPPFDSGAKIEEEIEFLQEETVSIAVQHEQPISEAPSNVYVITDEDIRQSGAISLPTVLRRIPGMEVIQMTGADFDVSVHGDNQPRANKLLVLVDGRSIYLDMQAEVLWKAIPVTLPEIKRIEVLKGPASALYGFNAFDGIINIITKSPEEMKGATVQVGGGEYGTLTSAAIYAGRHKKLGYRLSAGQDQTNQWNNRNSLAYRSYKVNGRFDYQLTGESNLTFSGGYLNSNRYDGPIVDVIRPAQQPSIGYANIGYERPNFFIRAWWTRYTQPSMINVNPLIPSGELVIFDSQKSSFQTLQANTSNIEGQHSIEFGYGNRLTYGFNYRHNEVSSNFLDGLGREDRFGLYIQDEWNLTPTVTAVGGLRYDMDTFINPTYSPRFSLVYKPLRDHTVRGGVAVAYRSPTIFETRTLSYSSIFGSPPNPLFGSNLLGPEQIISYDLGYQGWYWKHRVRTRVDLFFNHITDLIGTGQIPGSLNVTFFNGGSASQKGGSADIYGGEAGIEFLALPWLSGFANFAYQEIGQTFTANNNVVRGAPRFKINGGLRADFENGLNGEAALYYYGSARYGINPAFQQFLGPATPDTRVGSYFLLNLRAAYKFWKENGGHKAELAISVFNALNDKHKEHPLGATIGSRAMGWLTIRL